MYSHSLPVCSSWPSLHCCRIFLGRIPGSPSQSTQGIELAKSSGGTPRPTLEHAKNLIETHQEGAAIATLKRFLATSPKQEDLDDAYLLLAAALIGKKEHEEALTYLHQLLGEFPASDLAGRARLMIGAAQLALGKSDAALSALTEAKSSVEDPETKRQALRMVAELHTQKGDIPRAIQAWIEEMSLAPAEQRRESRERIKDLVFEKMDKKALMRLRETYPAEFPGDLALIRLIEMQNAQGEEHLAERNIRVFLARFPTHDYAPVATDMLRAFQGKLQASQHIIAAVLPLSGKLQAFGTEALNGIEIAVDKARDHLGMNAIGLQVIDSETDKMALRLELAICSTNATHWPSSDHCSLGIYHWLPHWPTKRDSICDTIRQHVRCPTSWRLSVQHGDDAATASATSRRLCDWSGRLSPLLHFISRYSLWTRAGRAVQQ